MKSPTDIRARVRGLLVRELDLRIEEVTKRLPHLCQHNHRQPLDTRKTVDGEPNEDYNRTTKRGLPVVQTLGLCMLGSENPEEWGGTICEDPIDAQRCSDFKTVRSKHSIRDEMLDQLVTPGWAEDHMPEVAHLMWVLEGTDLLVGFLPWWKRLLFWFLRIRVEPVLVLGDDVTKLLPIPPDKEPDDDTGLSS